jgi:indolepyruvate ferredoxin oxidoreductase beta subunit
MIPKQQIIISGVGGQGVLFVTRMLAEAAIRKGYPVLAAETHGMAQRGGTVISHLKVGHFSSPLIRPARADGLIALKADNLPRHGFFLKKGGWAVANGTCRPAAEIDARIFCLEADRIAVELNSARSVNLVMLGALFRLEADPPFCSIEDIQAILSEKLFDNQTLLAVSLKALSAGYQSDLQG